MMTEERDSNKDIKNNSDWHVKQYNSQRGFHAEKKVGEICVVAVNIL